VPHGVRFRAAGHELKKALTEPMLNAEMDVHLSAEEERWATTATAPA
jgi:transposase-like protein